MENLNNQEPLGVISEQLRVLDKVEIFATLEQATLLTADNKLRVESHQHLGGLNIMLVGMFSNGLLNQHTFELACDCPYPMSLSTVIKGLSDWGLLTLEHFEMVLKHQDPHGVAAAFGELHDAKLLTPENKAKVLMHSNAEELTDGIYQLSKNGLMSQNYFDILAVCERPKSIAACIRALHAAHLMDYQNLLAVTQYAKSEALATILEITGSLAFLDQDVFNQLLVHTELESLSWACIKLDVAGILVPDNFHIILVHPAIEFLVPVFNLLDYVGLLNQNSFNQAIQHAEPRLLFLVIERLRVANMLNQENLMHMFDPRHAVLLTEEAYQQFWRQVPDVLIIENWSRILELSRQVDGLEQLLIEMQFLIDELNRNNTRTHRFLAFIHRLIELVNEEELAQDNINSSQSTHLQSVHQSVSASASKLLSRYESAIQKHSLAVSLNQLKDMLTAQPESFIAKAAIRGFNRICVSEFEFVDKVSDISVQKLLALIRYAIDDDRVLVEYAQHHGAQACSVSELKQNGLKQLTSALYEIQRGYNLSENGEDDGLQDRPICPGGSFNKLIQGLQGVHPDCEIVFISKQSFFAKLVSLVKREAIAYLATAPGYLMIAAVQRDGIKAIWEQISESIITELMEEFGQLFRHNREDKEFLELISQAQEYVELTETEFERLRSPSVAAHSIFGAAPSNDPIKPSPRPS